MTLQPIDTADLSLAADAAHAVNPWVALAYLAAGVLFIYQQKLIANREREACFKAFLNNNYVGLVLFLGLAVSYWA